VEGGVIVPESWARSTRGRVCWAFEEVGTSSLDDLRARGMGGRVFGGCDGEATGLRAKAACLSSGARDGSGCA